MRSGRGARGVGDLSHGDIAPLLQEDATGSVEQVIKAELRGSCHRGRVQVNF